jgi:hypothetical protein
MSSLTKYRMVETGVLHLRDAADEPMYADGADGKPDLTKPMRWHGYGPGSKQFADAMNAKQNHYVDLLKRKGKTKESAADASRSNAEFLAACTERLENIDEVPIDVFMDQRLSFIRDQIAVFQNETSNFTNGSVKP